MRSAAGNLDFVIRSNISHHSDSEGCENSFEFVTGEGEGGWASARAWARAGGAGGLFWRHCRR